MPPCALNTVLLLPRPGGETKNYILVVGVRFDVRVPGMSSPFWRHHLITFFISYFINLSLFKHHSYRLRLSTLPSALGPGDENMLLRFITQPKHIMFSHFTTCYSIFLELTPFVSTLKFVDGCSNINQIAEVILSESAMKNLTKCSVVKI